MEDVPLTAGRKIQAGTTITGEIVSVSAAGMNEQKISFRFNSINFRLYRVQFITNVRAMASFMDVAFAETPEMTPGFGDPYVWSTTDLIGGGVKYGAIGPVTDQRGEITGKGTLDGVLVHLQSQPSAARRGALGEDRLQALWMFSSLLAAFME